MMDYRVLPKYLFAGVILVLSATEVFRVCNMYYKHK